MSKIQLYNGDCLEVMKKIANQSIEEYLINTYTSQGDTVLDNCMGSGSTGVAALNTGRNFIGIERDNKYYEIALNRIKNCQGEINEINTKK